MSNNLRRRKENFASLNYGLATILSEPEISNECCEGAPRESR
jgi:hypothetical protein